jgi:hypothetical protein
MLSEHTIIIDKGIEPSLQKRSAHYNVNVLYKRTTLVERVYVLVYGTLDFLHHPPLHIKFF